MQIVQQNGMKIVESMGQVSTISVTERLPVEAQPSRKQISGPGNFSDFLTPVQASSDLGRYSMIYLPLEICFKKIVWKIF